MRRADVPVLVSVMMRAASLAEADSTTASAVASEAESGY